MVAYVTDKDMDNGYNFYDNAPGNFSLCFKAGCASAGRCLRWLAGRDLGTGTRFVSVANPLLADGRGEGACPFFRRAEKVRVAYGFKRAMGQVPSGRVAGARAAVFPMISRRYYYYLLNGDRPLWPEDQEQVASVLQGYGVPAPVEFDRYEWQYRWE